MVAERQALERIDRLPTGTGRLEFVPLGSFELESGIVLPSLTVGYRHDGPPPGEAPQVLVVHPLTGSADGLRLFAAAGASRERLAA